MSEYIGNEDIKKAIANYIDNNDMPHLLLHASSGTGKTSLAKILVSEINCDHIYINASDENSVEVIRNKVKTFASNVGFNDWKVIILDECLLEGTLVSILREGNYIKVPIEELIEETDLVKSYNFKTNQIEWQPFYFWDKGEQELWEIELENGETVKCTAEHKWHVYDENNEIKVVKTDELHTYESIISPGTPII